MNFGYDIVVTITGMVLVFSVLVLLMFIIVLEGKIFDSINARKKAKRDAAHAANAAVLRAENAAAAAAAVAPVPEGPDVEEGIPGEVVAAIAAAIHALGGGKYTLRAVRRAGHSNGRGVWGKAGVSDTTQPF